MTAEALKIIDDAMADLGIEYAYGEYKGKGYPYFTGEYQEIPSNSENGSEETTFIMDGFSRTSKYELEEVKAKIKEKFHPIDGYIVTAPSGRVVAIFYEQGLGVPTGDAELKKIQINLSVKEWSVK